MAPLSIHTINARDNVALEVARGYFKLIPERVLLEIRTMLAQVKDVLAAKGIAYRELKSGLVPSTKRQEAAFVFDSLQIADGWYGRQVFEQILALFGRSSISSSSEFSSLNSPPGPILGSVKHHAHEAAVD